MVDTSKEDIETFSQMFKTPEDASSFFDILKRYGFLQGVSITTTATTSSRSKLVLNYLYAYYSGTSDSTLLGADLTHSLAILPKITPRVFEVYDEVLPKWPANHFRTWTVRTTADKSLRHNSNAVMYNDLEKLFDSYIKKLRKSFTKWSISQKKLPLYLLAEFNSYAPVGQQAAGSSDEWFDDYLNFDDLGFGPAEIFKLVSEKVKPVTLREMKLDATVPMEWLLPLLGESGKLTS